MPDNTPPWFAERPGDFLVFRVNRRPRGEDTLFPETPPEDVLDHFQRVLTPGWEVVSGRRNQRRWRLGGLELDDDERVLTGKLGWTPDGKEFVAEWSEDELDWVTHATTPHGNVLPFGFDGESRILTVLRDKGSAPTTIGGVFERVLRDNERELAEPTTEWSVEPVLDRQDFLAWLESVEVVRSVSFTAKLPNPEPRSDFADLVERMERRHATKFTETLLSDRDEGLSGIQEDRDFQQAVAMGTQGFATLRGKGLRDGTMARYSQSDGVATEHVEELPGTWDEMRELLLRFVKNELRRFLIQEQDSDEQ